MFSTCENSIGSYEFGYRNYYCEKPIKRYPGISVPVLKDMKVMKSTARLSITASKFRVPKELHALAKVLNTCQVSS